MMRRTIHCPECGATGEAVHRQGCDVQRALREYREWHDRARAVHE